MAMVWHNEITRQGKQSQPQGQKGPTMNTHTVNAELTIPADNDGTDTIIVTTTAGEEITRINLPASEDPEPYDEAIRTAGFDNFTWI